MNKEEEGCCKGLKGGEAKLGIAKEETRRRKERREMVLKYLYIFAFPAARTGTFPSKPGIDSARMRS